MREKENFLTFQSLFNLLWKVHRRHFLLLFSIVFIIFFSFNNFFLKNNLRGVDIIFIQKKNLYFDDKYYNEILDILNIYVSSGLIYKDLKKENLSDLPIIEIQGWDTSKHNKNTTLVKLQVTYNFISKEEYKNFNNTLIATLNEFLISNSNNLGSILVNNCKNSNEEIILFIFALKDPYLNSKKINLENNFNSFFLSNTRKYSNEVGNKYLYDLNSILQHSLNNQSLFLDQNLLNKFIFDLNSSRECLNSLISYNILKNDKIFEMIFPDSDNALRSLYLDLLPTIIISFIFALFSFYAYFFLYKSKN